MCRGPADQKKVRKAVELSAQTSCRSSEDPNLKVSSLLIDSAASRLFLPSAKATCRRSTTVVCHGAIRASCRRLSGTRYARA